MARHRWCKRPQFGYYCVWADGHLGECREYPDWWMELWLDFKSIFK